MKRFHRPLALAVACTALTLPHMAVAQAPIPPSISTPDKVESRLGPLEFKDGVPARATTDKLFDHLDFTYAIRAFMDNLQGVSIYSLAKGMRDLGVKDNEVLVFSELMDAKSLFLTANADTVYSMGMLDLTKGPTVLEVPPRRLARSMTTGSAGSSISVCRGPIEARAGNTSSCRPAMMVRYPRVSSLWLAPRPPASCGLVARS